MFHLNRRTKKGREEFNKIKEDTAKLVSLGQIEDQIYGRAKYHGYISNDDALKFVEISKRINDIDKTQSILQIKGNSFPKLLKTENMILFIIKENYKNE